VALTHYENTVGLTRVSGKNPHYGRVFSKNGRPVCRRGGGGVMMRNILN
jgi:hypothetical protein